MSSEAASGEAGPTAGDVLQILGDLVLLSSALSRG
jgi:hypothetical protein